MTFTSTGTENRVNFRAPTWAATFPSLVIGETTRHGGISPTPYDSLNLGWNTPDDPENVTENRRRLLASLGFQPGQLASTRQVHGSEVLVVDQPGRYDGFDALITAQPGIILSVSVADCTPVLVCDPETKAIAAIHAGWRGTVGGIVSKAIAMMKSRFNTNPSKCYAFIGACIDECSFEVDADVADHFIADFKRWDELARKFFIDLKAANQQQLLDAGIPTDHIEVSPFSTVLHNEDYFSHRKERGITGRFSGMIGWRVEH